MFCVCLALYKQRGNSALVQGLSTVNTRPDKPCSWKAALTHGRACTATGACWSCEPPIVLMEGTATSLLAHTALKNSKREQRDDAHSCLVPAHHQAEEGAKDLNFGVQQG